MATIGSIAVALKAQTEHFTSGLGKAAASVKGLAASVTSAVAPVAGLAAAITGVAGLAGIGLLVKSQMEAIDTTAKLADRLGVTTEALVGLQHAAAISGSDAASLGTALDQMTKRLGEAALKGGETKDALANIGLSIDDLLGRGADEQFQAIAEAISHLGTQEEKAAAAAALFGKSGIELLNVLQLGSRGLQEMQEDAERLGLTFSRIEAAKVEAANDALTRVHEMVQAVGRRLSIELAPLIEEAARSIIEWGQTGEGWGGKVRDAIGWVVEATGTAVDAFNVLRGTVEVVFGVAAGVVAGFLEVLEHLVGGVENTVEVLTLGFADISWGEDVERLKDQVGEFSDALKEAGSAHIDSGFSGEAGRGFLGWLDQIEAKADAAARSVTSLSSAGQGLQGLPAAGAARGAPDDDGARAADRRAKDEERAYAAAKQRVDQMLRIQGLQAEDREYAHEILEIEDMRAKGWADLANWARILLDNKRAAAKEDAEQKKASEAAEKAGRDAAALGERIAEGVARQAEEDQRATDAKQRSVESMTRELELLRAANEYERERVRIRQDLADAIKDAKGDQEQIDLAKQVASEKLADVAEDEARAAERKAEAERKATSELREQRRLIGSRADITKRFDNMGGTSLFGFGRGQVGTGLGDIGYDVARAQAGATRFSTHPAASSPGAGASVPQLKDLSPQVQAVLKAWQQVPPLWERLGAALGELSKAVPAGVERMTAATEKSVARLRDGLKQLSTRLDAFEERLARASDVGVAGA